MKIELKIILAGSPKTQVLAMTRLISSGKEQVRLVKELGAPARILYDAKFEYLDIANPTIAPLLEEALIVFLIKDRESLNALEKLVRSKALESAIDYVVITTAELSLRILSGMRDTAINDKLVTYTDPMSSQVAYSIVKLIEANADHWPAALPAPEIIEEIVEQQVPKADDAELSPTELSPTELLPTITDIAVDMSAASSKVSLSETLQKLMAIDGALAACLVDSRNGMVLGKSSGSKINLDIAAAGNTEVLRAKLKTLKALGMPNKIEDILMTCETQIHILRPVHVKPTVFLYVILDKARSNLAQARLKTAEAEISLVLP
jgi:predicted regulator of Ras-like GTPase activity (Roadblock/LC7/MglB family)